MSNTDTPITDEAWGRPYTRQDHRLHAMRRTCIELEREAAAWREVAEMYRNTHGVTGLDEADEAFDTLKSELTQP